MTAVAMPVRQRTPEWIDARRDVIGSSDIPIITGNSPYRSSLLDLWAYKTRLLEPDPPDPETEELWELGHLLEDDIAERYTAKTGRPLRRANRMLRHRSLAWAAASLDRVSAVAGERRIVEVKWVPHRHWTTDGPEPIPAYVQDQVQWQLLVTGWPVADVAVLNGSRVEHHEVTPNAEYQDNLLFLARWFRGFVERGEYPPIDGSEATRKVLGRLHPRNTLEFAEPTAELEALAREERAASVAFEASKEEHGRIRNVLRSVLGDHAGADGGDWRISFRKSADSTRAETDWQAVASAYRQLIDRMLAAAPDVLGLGLDPWNAVIAIESLHTATTTREGARPLLVRVRNEEDGKWT